MRNAKTEVDITPQGMTTGEPCASKVASTVRRGAFGKGTRRLSVMDIRTPAEVVNLAKRLPNHDTTECVASSVPLSSVVKSLRV